MELENLDCTPKINFEKQLLESIEKNDLKTLNLILENQEININYEFTHPHNKTLLQIACFKYADTINEEVIKTLLLHGADPLLKNKHFKNKQCINFAAEGGKINILKIIINEYSKTEEGKRQLEKSDVIINLILYIFMGKKFSKSDKKIDGQYEKIFDILLKHNIDVNIPDINGWTPIYAAAKYGFRDVVEKILNSRNTVDLDSFKDPKGKSARDLISENNLYNGELPSKTDEISCETLKNFVRSGEIEDFKICFERIKNTLTDDEKNILLYIAVENNNCEIVKIITQSSEDSLRILSGRDKSPLQHACKQGYHRIVELLLQKQQTPECLSKGLIETSKQMQINRNESDVNYEKCVELLLQNNDIKINEQDWNENTSLHYTTKYQNPDMSLQLLRKGASLASKNSFGVMAIADMSADVLKTHLDECIVEGNEKQNDHESKYIIINFMSLLPPRKDTKCVNNNAQDVKIEVNHERLLNDDNNQNILNENVQVNSLSDLAIETEVLQYMSTSHELKSLLTHPVIMTFLYLKWYRVRNFFCINLAIYLTFFISLLTYVFFCYNNELEMRSKLQQYIVDISYVIVSIMLILLMIRELAQIFIFRWRYLKIFENWLELTLLLVTLAIVINQNEEIIIKQLAAIAILLSAIDLLLMVGQIPSLSSNIMMLRTVSLTFFKLLLWYSILIIAFALSFYTLFKKNSNSKPTEEDEENNFFIDPGLSMFKTIVMLTGEFDASDINFDTYPIISHLIFLSFVFLIAIVLFNLLNGLAVSDTQMIKNDAELYSQIVRVEHVAHVERLLLSKKFCQFLTYVKRICLFPNNIKKTEIKIYQHSNWEVKFNDDHNMNNQCYRCQQILLDKKISRKIKSVIQECKETKLKTEKEEIILQKLLKLEQQQENLFKLLKSNHNI